MNVVNQDLTGQGLDDFLQNELSTLGSTLDDTYNVLSQKWIGTELPAQLSRLSRVHGDKIRHYNDEIEGHVSTVKKIQTLGTSNRKALEDQIQRLTELRQELRALTTQTQSAEQQQKKLSSEISQAQRDNTCTKKALEGNVKDTEKTQQELEKALGFYRERLGLRFQKISGGRLQYCFSLIDKENVDTCCYFCLKVNSDKSYTVSDFSPPIEDVHDLQQKLNDTNDLRSFIVAVRKRFIKALNSPK
uniref:Kinetochore protein SPC25 n=1 Tax=Crassostrea virginica TaxID=6565 RepID=A0A8B8BYR8_CRAVI|nr:kinetochore protein Spc25-like [Crassostrea virginica]